MLSGLAAAYLLGVVLVLGIFYLAPRPGGWPVQARRLRSFGWELLAALPTQLLLLPMAIFWPWWWRRGTGRPILLLHGYAQTRGDFWLLAPRLRRALGRPVHGMNYWFLAEPSRCADRLHRVVEAILADSGAPSLDIVAHSYGGIVARSLLERSPAIRRKIRLLVTVATPHRGTWWARLGPGRSARFMTPGSAFLQELPNPRPPKGVTYAAVWSRADAVVTPPDSASLLGAGKEEVENGLGHLSLLCSRRVAHLVARWLRDVQQTDRFPE